MIDVKTKHCEEAGCTTCANYGLPAKEPNTCAQHKKIGMIVNPRKICAYSACKNTSTHEYKFKRFCETHAPPDATNLAISICSNCGLPDVLTQDKCTSCDPATITHITHEKELRVKAILDATNLKYISHDRIIDGGACEKYRPDFVFDATTHMVVLEVDENQHKSYACLCEQQRMVNISQALGMPTLFIRYNPDGFTNMANNPVNFSEVARSKLLTD